MPNTFTFDVDSTHGFDPAEHEDTVKRCDQFTFNGAASDIVYIFVKVGNSYQSTDDLFGYDSLEPGSAVHTVCSDAPLTEYTLSTCSSGPCPETKGEGVVGYANGKINVSGPVHEGCE